MGSKLRRRGGKHHRSERIWLPSLCEREGNRIFSIGGEEREKGKGDQLCGFWERGVQSVSIQKETSGPGDRATGGGGGGGQLKTALVFCQGTFLYTVDRCVHAGRKEAKPRKLPYSTAREKKEYFSVDISKKKTIVNLRGK